MPERIILIYFVGIKWMLTPAHKTVYNVIVEYEICQHERTKFAHPIRPPFYYNGLYSFVCPPPQGTVNIVQQTSL